MDQVVIANIATQVLALLTIARIINIIGLHKHYKQVWEKALVNNLRFVTQQTHLQGSKTLSKIILVMQATTLMLLKVYTLSRAMGKFLLLKTLKFKKNVWLLVLIFVHFTEGNEVKRFCWLNN